MNFGKRLRDFFGSSFVKFLDNFGGDSIARLVAVYTEEKAEVVIMLDHGESFGTELLDAVLHDSECGVIGAVAAITEDFGGFKTGLNVGDGEVEKNDSLDFVARLSGFGEDLVFFAEPAADRGKYEWLVFNGWFVKIRENPRVKNIGRDEVTFAGVILASFGLLLPNNVTGR